MPRARTSSTGSEPSISARSPQARSWPSSNSRSTPTAVYYPRLYTAQEARHRRALVGERRQDSCPSWRSPSRTCSSSAASSSTKGEHPMSLVAATRGPCDLRLPAARTGDAVLRGHRSRGADRRSGHRAEPPHRARATRCPGVSAGRVLAFHAEKAGQGFVLNLGKRPARPYVLGVRPMVGPDGGDHPGLRRRQADRSPVRSLRHRSAGSARRFCLLGPVPAGASGGRNPGGGAKRTVARDGMQTWITSAGSRPSWDPARPRASGPR